MKKKNLGGGRKKLGGGIKKIGKGGCRKKMGKRLKKDLRCGLKKTFQGRSKKKIKGWSQKKRSGIKKRWMLKNIEEKNFLTSERACTYTYMSQRASKLLHSPVAWVSERASVENAQIHSAASERAGFFQAYLQLADEQVSVELASERGTQNSCTRHPNLLHYI